MHTHQHPGATLQRVRRIHTAITRPPKFTWGFSFPSLSPEHEDMCAPDAPTPPRLSPALTSPGAKLMLGVIMQAISDATEPDYTPAPKRRRSRNAQIQITHRALVRETQRLDARQWFLSTRAEWPCDFESICETLDLDAAAIRAHVSRVIAAQARANRRAA